MVEYADRVVQMMDGHVVRELDERDDIRAVAREGRLGSADAERGAPPETPQGRRRQLMPA
jgi:hypothetical protein